MTLFDVIDNKRVDLTPEKVAEYEAKQAAAAARANDKLKAAILDATQVRLDDFARTRNYDGILPACTYAASTVPQFANEGQACVKLRDQTWAALYQMLAEVEAGQRPIPSSFDDIKGDLPTPAWPD